MIKRTELFGFNFISEPDINDVADAIINTTSYEKEGHFPFLVTPNVDDIVKFSKIENKELREYFSKSVFILPDGQPIIWASRLLRSKIAKRLTGADLLPLLLDDNGQCQLLALTCSDMISDSLRQKNPNVTPYTLPFFDKNDDETICQITDDCVDIILKNNIKIVIIGVSFPKQNILAIEIYDKLKNLGFDRMPLFCMLGASFEFYFQIKKRAPVYMQKMGFEWLHRFAKEPKRLFKRYFIEDMAFFPILLKEIRTSKKVKK